MFLASKSLYVNKYVYETLPKTILPRSNSLKSRNTFLVLARPSSSSRVTGESLHAGSRDENQASDQNNTRWRSPDSRDPSIPRGRRKYPGRGGRNLSQRYKRLERSLLGKRELRREIDEISEIASDLQRERGRTEANAGGNVAHTKRPKRKGPRVFAGFIIPEKPKPPEPDECCMSGCAVCVHDLYAESLEAYNKAIQALREKLKAKSIPESTWPPQVQIVGTKVDNKKGTVLSAFEELEQQIAKRQEAQSAASSVDALLSTSHSVGEFFPRINTSTRMDSQVDVPRLHKKRKASFSESANALTEIISWMLYSRR